MKFITVLGISAAAMAASAQPALQSRDRVFISPSLNYPYDGECTQIWNNDHELEKDSCQQSDEFRSLNTKFLPATSGHSIFNSKRCAVISFTDEDCHDDGEVVIELGFPNLGRECTSSAPFLNEYTVAGYSYKWACGDDILTQWDKPRTSASVHARALNTSVETTNSLADVNAMDKGVRGRVKVWPADNEDCNSPNKRKAESFKHDDCQRFNNGFRSIRAEVDFHNQKHPHRCMLVAFTDHKCKDNPVSVADLYDTSKRSVCHAVNLKQNDSHLMSGHSVKWICDDLIDECFGTSPQHEVKPTPTVVSVTTVTVACTVTTSVGMTVTASSDVITKTSLATHVITHTHVETHIQSTTMPFSSTFSVCDVEVTTLY